MYHLLAAYDLANYSSLRALGIVLSLVAAAIVLVITLMVYRKSQEAERRLAVADGPATDTSPAATEEPALCRDDVAESVTAESEQPSADDCAAAESVPAESEPAAETAEIAAEEMPPEETEQAPAPVAKTADETACDESVSASVAETAVSVSERYIPDFIGKLSDRMPDDARIVFNEAVVYDSRGIVSRVRPVGDYTDEKDFLHDFFLAISKYKKILPTSAVEVLYDRYGEYLKTDFERTRLNTKLIGAYYARRKEEEDALAKCEKLCRADVELNLTVRKVRKIRVYSLKRLVLIYTSEKKYADAVELCDRAIARKLIDQKNQGYEERRKMLAARLEKQQEREERKLMRQAKAAAKARKSVSAGNRDTQTEVGNEE